MSNTKLDGYSEKSFNDFVRDFAMGLNELKVNVLNKLSDPKSKQNVVREFSTLNSLLNKWNWGGYV